MTVEMVKVHLYSQEGWHPDRVCLTFNGKVLNELQTLEDYNIKHDDEIELVVLDDADEEIGAQTGSSDADEELGAQTGSSDKLQISVKMLSGKTITLDMTAVTDNIDDIKAKIQEMEGIPAHYQQFIFNNDVITDCSQLNDGDELNLVVVENPLFELSCYIFPNDFEFSVTAHAKMQMWQLKHVIYSKLKDDPNFKVFRPKMQKLYHYHMDDEEEQEETDEIKEDSTTLEQLGINEKTSQQVSDHTDELKHRIGVLYDDGLEDSEASEPDDEPLEFPEVAPPPDFPITAHIDSHETVVMVNQFTNIRTLKEKIAALTGRDANTLQLQHVENNFNLAGHDKACLCALNIKENHNIVLL
jgi:hypothetical protein